MEVRIGVQHAGRELVIDSEQSQAEIQKAITSAAGGVLSLADSSGRLVIVPVDKLAYVEIGEPEARRVGFGAL